MMYLKGITYAIMQKFVYNTNKKHEYMKEIVQYNQSYTMQFVKSIMALRIK